MRFGPSSLRVSGILARGLRRPKLRSDLKISKQIVAGEIGYVIKNPETNSYERYGETEFEILSLCDGTRTPGEMAEELTRRHPEAPRDESEIREFLDGMEPEMWERSLGEKNLAILERIRDERKHRVDQTKLSYITFSAWDPDKTLAKLDRYFGWLYSKGFVIFSVAVMLFAIGLVISDGGRIARDTADLWNFSNKSAADIFTFWVLMLGLGGIHELGHGLTCKHYGGDVHQMGFMLIYFTPAFFTDTTDLLLFSNLAPREWTIFAGIWIELVIFGVSSLLWYFTFPGSFLNGLTYKIMLLSGIQGAVLNLNPLIKADGYYALSQYLKMDSLREDSMEYLKAWLQKYILRKDIDLPAASRRERRIFLSFSTAALFYSYSLVVLMGLWAKNIFVSKFGIWGYGALALLIYLFLRKRIRKAWPGVVAKYAKKKEELMAWRLSHAQTAGLAAVVALLAFAPIPSTVTAGFTLEPGRQADARVRVPGVIQQVFVGEGDEVHEGQVLAVLANPEIEAAAAVDAQRLALAQGRWRAAEASANDAAIATASREAKQLQQDLDVDRQKSAELEIRAPIGGVVTTPELRETEGQHFTEGEMFCHLADRREMRARILVRDWDLQDVRPGARVEMKITTYPMRTYASRVEQILPAAAADQPVANPAKLTANGQELTNYFAAETRIPNPSGVLREGLTGTAKIFAASRPLAWQWGREWWRWIRSQVW